MSKTKVILRLAVFFLVSFAHVSQSFVENSKIEFTKLRNEYVANDKADILFLIDSSGSLSRSDFDAEKQFVTDFLRKIRVTMEATRVEVIPFGTTARRFLDQVSSPTSTKNKCTFNEKLNLLSHEFGMTNMKDAFQLAYDICVGKYNGQKRGPLNKVKTTVILLTDGMWNWPWPDPSPVPIAQQLHAVGVEVYVIGVGINNAFVHLERVTRDPTTQAFRLAGFYQLRELSLYLKRGKL